jgi:hypothetical protein
VNKKCGQQVKHMHMLQVHCQMIHPLYTLAQLHCTTCSSAIPFQQCCSCAGRNSQQDRAHGCGTSTAQHSTAQHSTAQHSTAQHSTAITAAGYYTSTSQPYFAYCNLYMPADHSHNKVHTSVGETTTPRHISRCTRTCHKFPKELLTRSSGSAPAAAATPLMLSQMLRNQVQPQGYQWACVLALAATKAALVPRSCAQCLAAAHISPHLHLAWPPASLGACTACSRKQAASGTLMSSSTRSGPSAILPCCYFAALLLSPSKHLHARQVSMWCLQAPGWACAGSTPWHTWHAGSSPLSIERACRHLCNQTLH